MISHVRHKKMKEEVLQCLHPCCLWSPTHVDVVADEVSAAMMVVLAVAFDESSGTTNNSLCLHLGLVARRASQDN